MQFDYASFQQRLEDLTRVTFKTSLTKLPAPEIAGFALYSDNAAMTISVSLNTFTHLRQLQAKSPEYADYYRWTPGEWRYEMINAKAFAELNQQLRDAHEEVNKVFFDKHQYQVYECAVAVLEKLREEGTFDVLDEEAVLLFAVSDFSDPGFEIKTARRLNDAGKGDQFEAWIESEEEDDDDY